MAYKAGDMVRFKECYVQKTSGISMLAILELAMFVEVSEKERASARSFSYE